MKKKQVAIILEYHSDEKVEEENKIKIEMKRRRKNRTSAKQLMKSNNKFCKIIYILQNEREEDSKFIFSNLEN